MASAQLNEGAITVELVNGRVTVGAAATPTPTPTATPAPTPTPTPVPTPTPITGTGSLVVADDNQAAFWTSLNPAADVAIANDSAIKKEGADSLRVDILRTNRRSYTLLEHEYAQMQDWSQMRFVKFWFKGTGSGVKLSFDINSDRQESKRTGIYFTDSSADWVLMQLPLPVGASPVDWSKVSRIRLAWDTKDVAGSLYLDALTLLASLQPVPTPTPTPVATATPTPTPTPLPPSLTIKVASTRLRVGETATLDITARNVPATGLTGYQASLSYDPAVVRVNAVLGGDAPFDGAPDYDVDSSQATVNFAAVAAQGPTSGDVVLARVSLTALGGPGSESSLHLTIRELVNNSLNSITTWQVEDGTVTIKGVAVAQSISQALESVNEGASVKKKVWITLRAEGGLLGSQPASLEGGIRSVEAALSYDPTCMTVLAAKGTAPFATALASISPTAGTVSLTVAVPTGAAAAQAPAEFGRLLVRLTGSSLVPCPLTLSVATLYRSGDGSTSWEAAGAVSRQYQRGDARGNGTVGSVTQAIAMLRFLVASDSNAAMTTINAVNAASIKSDAPTVEGQPDTGDHISLADAILTLRRVVKLVDAHFQPCGQQACE